MANEELERLKTEYQTLKRYCETLADYREKARTAEKALNESRGFTSAEYKENCLKEKEINEKAYNDLLEEYLARYNKTTLIALKYEIRELEAK